MSGYTPPGSGPANAKNMVWAIGLNILVVAVVAAIILWPDSKDFTSRETVDVAASAEEAAGIAPFDPAVPDLGSAWEPRSVHYDSSAESWQITYTAPSGQSATVKQRAAGKGLDTKLLAGAIELGSDASGAPEHCTAYEIPAGDSGSEKSGMACDDGASSWTVTAASESEATDLAGAVDSARKP